MSDKKICILCGESNWLDIDQFRDKKEKMIMCNKCGFITYDKWHNLEEYYNHYRGNQYRKPPVANNLYTSINKIYYHEAFLKDLFNEWKEQNKKPVFLDVGAAYGVYLDWCRNHFPVDAPKDCKDVPKYLIEDSMKRFNGTELTLSYRRCAWHEYRLNLTEEVDKSKKYDLISIYKVLEHIPDADVKLKEYVDCLSDDGYMYISNPVWFNELSIFGTNDMVTLDAYFHTNHVNVWTENLSKTLIKKSGLKIIKENYTYYGSTYLCQKTDEKQELIYEDPKEILKKLEKVKQAVEAYSKKEFKKAGEIWPNFPETWFALYELNRKIFHREGGLDFIEKEFINRTKELLPNNVDMLYLYGDICQRYERYDKALEYYNKNLELKPNNIRTLNQMANCFYAMGNFQKAREIRSFIKINFPQALTESLNWIYACNALIKTPFEKN